MGAPGAVLALGLDSQSWQEAVGSRSCTPEAPDTVQSRIYSSPQLPSLEACAWFGGYWQLSHAH